MWKKFRLVESTVRAGDLDVCRIKIDGYLDSSTFPQLQDHLNRLLEENRKNCVLDLKDLDYISSAGLGVLMSILRQVQESGGDLKIVNMSEKIQRVFNLLGFSRMMRVYHSEQEALDAFGESAGEPEPGAGEGKPEEEY